MQSPTSANSAAKPAKNVALNGLRAEAKLDDLGIAHSGVKQFDYTRNAMLTFRDPDNIQLEFFWRAPPEPGE